MARQRNPIPTYRFHASTGKGIVTYYEGHVRKSILLPGPFNSKESLTEYKRILAIIKAGGLPRAQAERNDTPSLTITDLIERYWRHVEEYYRRTDGTPTQEVASMMFSLRPLNHLHGEELANEYGPLALKAVRELMIEGYVHPKYRKQESLCRGEINKRIKRIRRMFKWAVENELVDAKVLTALQSVAPLKAGRTSARDTEPVMPVARAVVEDTLPILYTTLQDMVMLQMETGMRSGELVIMRACDIDMTGQTWLYKPTQHKTKHHAHQRIIAIGPKGQAILRRHLTAQLDTFIFSPAAVMEERSIALRAKRKTRVQPSQRNRRKTNRKKKPGERYTPQSFQQAIAKAIQRHNTAKPESVHIPHWHPHQLRHLRALELKRQFGLDVVRSVLGQRSPVIAEHYATLDTAAAIGAMSKIG